MNKLTEYQKNFLLEYFFRNEAYVGWKNIATKLLEKGECIVAGNECIWNGGIGNFINTEKAENAVDCLLYKFDLDVFLSSEWYKMISNDYISILSTKKMQINDEYNDITSL